MPNISTAQGCMEAESDEGVSVKGFLQPQFDYTFDGENNENTYKFNRARLGVVGNIPYDFSYYFILEASPFKGGEGKVYLLDAFVSYSRFSFAKVSIGQFKSPFSLEQNTSCSGLHTINRSLVVNELAGPIRELGLMIHGDIIKDKLKYKLAFMNGTGHGEIDDNSSKTIAGRVVISPLKFISIGGSFKHGKNPPKADGVEVEDETMRYAADLELKFGEFLIQGEYIFGQDKGSSIEGGGCGETPVTVVGDFKKSGYFMQAMYMLPFNLQPILKLESYDADLDETEPNEKMITTFGFNYFFNDWTRLQLNYLYQAEKGHEVKNDMLMLQIQVKF